ncbi:class I SAM-dependent methyltransferase [Vibrio profundum]|uniref:class I SAM-dependent DNA methyltransferase n=1 Tax=Vibrio profundum TaxID=2910247 RepID=UPI003D0D7691
MKPKDIGLAYDQITHLWEDNDFDLSNGIVPHQIALQFSRNRGNALDIGCGCTGRFEDLLIEEGFKVEGVDISSEMIKIIRQKHPDLTFYHQDICEWALPKKYDFITAWDSIWHIPLVQQEKVLTKIISSLNRSGIFIFSFGGTEEQGQHNDDFMGPEVHYSSLGTNGIVSLLIKLGCVIRHVEFDQYPELHTYAIVEKA